MRALRRDEHGARRLVVLGLREEVHGHPVGRRAAIGDDQDFRRSGEHVDADVAENLALRLGDVRVARADDLVDAGDRFGAEGERRYGVRTAHRQDSIDAGECRRGERGRIGIGARHHQLAYPGDLRRHGVHQDRRGVGRLAAGHVQAYARQRAHALPEARAVAFRVIPRSLHLALVEGADALERVAQPLRLLARQAGKRLLGLLAWHLELGGAARLARIEAPAVFDERRIAAPLHIGEDVLHGVPDGRVPTRLVARQRRKLGVESGRAGGKAAQRHARAALAKASMSGCNRARLVLSAAWFTIRRADTGMISSTATKSLSRSVRPLDTRSTMASARPVSGASSIEPYRRMISTCTPFTAKCSRVVLRYFVATRSRAPWRTAAS